MKNYEKIVNFVNKKNNVITTKEFKDAKIGFYYINKLIEDNYISRIGNGLYGKTDSFEDEYFIIQNRYKNAIFSYNTALFFLNKTEVTPNIIDITIPNDYNVLGKCWNYCELASKNYPDSLFIKKLDSILQEKNFYTIEKKKEKEKSFFSMFFGKDKI